jgi:hypothetical protein
MADETPKTSLFEILVAILLGLGAIGGGWASYQASQWGSTALEKFGESSKTATQGSTVFNLGVAVATRDSALDIQGKTLMIDSMLVDATTQPGAVAKMRNLGIAKYLYLIQMSSQAYAELGLDPKYKALKRNQVDQMPDAEIAKALTKDLGTEYFQKVLTPGAQKFEEAEKIFKEGDTISGRSTKFGQAQMVFTIALFLGGLALVVKSNLKWGFMAVGYGTMIFGCVKLLSLPWY